MYLRSTEIFQKDNEDLNVSSVFTLEYFIEYLNKRIAESSVGKDYLINARDLIIQNFDKDDFIISSEKLEEYENVFRQIYLLMVSPLDSEEDVLWGLSPIFSSDFVYGTDALAKLYRVFENYKLISILSFENDHTSEREIKEILLYSLIVKRLYGYDMFQYADMIMKVSDGSEEKYYQFAFNEAFAEVIYNGMLPSIDMNLIELEHFDNQKILNWLKEKLPLDNVELRGFFTIKMEDVTFRMLKEKVKSLFLTQSIDSSFHTSISAITKQIMGNNEIDMLILPILELDGKIIRELWQNFETDISLLLEKYKVDEEDFLTIITKFINNPNTIFRDNIEKHSDRNRDLFAHSIRNNLSGFIMYPVTGRSGVTGVVIVMSSKAGVISDLMLSNLDDLLPLMQNMFNSLRGNYLWQLDKVIKNEFTAIQPSVAWKFNNAGIRYLKEKEYAESPEITPIQFDEVYPVFGAIDFRNSTYERNKAQFEDFINQIEELKLTLNAVLKVKQIDLIHQLIYQCEQWVIRLQTNVLTANEESQIIYFLDIYSLEIVKNISFDNSGIKEVTGLYLKQIEDKNIFHRNRLALERTFNTLNSSIIHILDDMNEKLQDAYPCYFERYRTDGVEYNLYIGQSIAPEKPFSNFYVKNVRLWQLNMMASVARITEAAQDLFVKKIQTTQLIFVHPGTISISFRSDEKRFDVEGAYNIRYEVAKKRIDKAYVKNINERLTQPNKIAIVYYHKNDIEEYLEHIRFLQTKNILEPEIEELELEDMQGITGLKAIRVQVVDSELDSQEQQYFSRIQKSR